LCFTLLLGPAIGMPGRSIAYSSVQKLQVTYTNVGLISRWVGVGVTSAHPPYA